MLDGVVFRPPPAAAAAVRPAVGDVTLADVERARRAIAPYVRETPLARSETLSRRIGANVYAKLEVFQKTGAFKVRGAFNRLLALGPSERARGVVAVSQGNHAQAVAYAARELGVRALVVMPETAPRNYAEATRGYGAEVVFAPTMHDAFALASQLAEEGRVYVHPFDDPEVIAGQGTLGLEIVEALPAVTDVVMSIGGGGLAGGAAVALKGHKADVRVWGVETEGTCSMASALEAGCVVTLPKVSSVASTLGAPAVTERTLALAQVHLEGVTVVSDAEALDAQRDILERLKVLTEPAASCTLAAADRLRGRFTADSHVVLVLCGGNAALDDHWPSRS
jgi:threonine dehydratase